MQVVKRFKFLCGRDRIVSCKLNVLRAYDIQRKYRSNFASRTVLFVFEKTSHFIKSELHFYVSK